MTMISLEIFLQLWKKWPKAKAFKSWPGTWWMRKRRPKKTTRTPALSSLSLLRSIRYVTHLSGNHFYTKKYAIVPVHYTDSGGTKIKNHKWKYVHWHWYSSMKINSMMQNSIINKPRNYSLTQSYHIFGDILFILIFW